MRKGIRLAVVLGFLFVTVTGAFAYEQKSSVYPWMASFNKTGQVNLYASAGFYYVGFDVSAGPELILGNLDLSGIPLQWGVAARGIVGFGSYAGVSWLDWGAAPLVTLHWGIDVGGLGKFEWYGGVGVGLYGTTGTYYTFLKGGGPFIGFASADGIVWHFSDKVGLILDYAYVGWTSVYGVGVKINS